MFNYNNFRINEIDFNIVETEFTILRSDNIERYDFISKKGNSYSVYFKMTDEDDEELSNGNQLSAYTDLDKIPTIFFSLTKRGLNDDLVDKKEQLEIMGKVVYIILEYIETNNFTTYSIGEVGDKKINFYNYYRKHFNSMEILTGKSKNYLDNDDNKKISYYLIKKENDELPEKIKLDENLYLKIKNKK